MSKYSRKLTYFSWSSELNMLIPVFETYYNNEILAMNDFEDKLSVINNDTMYGKGNWYVVNDYVSGSAKAVFANDEKNHPQEMYTLTRVYTSEIN